MGLDLFSSAGANPANWPQTNSNGLPADTFKSPWYEIIKGVQIQSKSPHVKFTIIEVHYKKCTNFDGRKILVYKNNSLHALAITKNLDPHFLDPMKTTTPIARFRPTAEGWQMAEQFCKNYQDPDSQPY